ncbi:GntR family transcriptional regulator [Rhodococcoides trifolii]|uniref:GntR family transcriptional regulator n=1 Tax=Rhodococcoides trifolii TaxID=908250 RepID=A0A917CY44_9NOCA|nr:PLP-dependent aminotransferase family protein [Rhodococcus trifolii]GGG01176.1 GntR family transcriptional regulator [Rhodococcus trifolii]
MLATSISVVLNRDDRRTLPVQLSDAIRAAIVRGELPSGARLPSTRAMSTDLGVARGVVERAFDQLTAEGWIGSTRGSGTYVTEAAHTVVHTPVRVAPTREEHVSTRIALRPGLPWTPPRPSPAWRRAWRDVGATGAPGEYPDPAGEPDVRATVSELLARTRGLHVDPAHIVITSGTNHAASLAFSALGLDRRLPTLVLEDPGYRAAAATARSRGWTLHDVPVDRDGLRTDLLSAAPPSTRAVYVTPSHQYPTGGLLPVARRTALARFAVTRDVMIVEDDYDSEFRYDVAPLPTLAELAPGRVVYLGTVAKTLGAGVRFGWLSAPPDLVEQIVEQRTATADFPSVPIQRAVTSLIRDGEWDRLVRAARRRYRARDTQVAAALSDFGELRGLGAGMHTTLILDPHVAQQVAAAAAMHAVDVPLLAESTRSITGVGGLVIGYGRVDEDELNLALRVIRDALTKFS